ncbi:hypothetical protein BJY52DRAFT_1238219, partial [Lactarius psammicola]
MHPLSSPPYGDILLAIFLLAHGSTIFFWYSSLLLEPLIGRVFSLPDQRCDPTCRRVVVICTRQIRASLACFSVTIKDDALRVSTRS